MAAHTLADVTRAASDADLLARLTSAAAEAGVANPQGWAEANARRLVTLDLTGNGDSLASLHAYAVTQYAPTPRPGENAAVVTDAHLRTAVAKLNTPA